MITVGELVRVNAVAYNSMMAHSQGCGSDDDCGCEEKVVASVVETPNVNKKGRKV